MTKETKATSAALLPFVELVKLAERKKGTKSANLLKRAEAAIKKPKFLLKLAQQATVEAEKATKKELKATKALKKAQAEHKVSQNKIDIAERKVKQLSDNVHLAKHNLARAEQVVALKETAKRSLAAGTVDAAVQQADLDVEVAAANIIKQEAQTKLIVAQKKCTPAEKKLAKASHQLALSNKKLQYAKQELEKAKQITEKKHLFEKNMWERSGLEKPVKHNLNWKPIIIVGSVVLGLIVVGGIVAICFFAPGVFGVVAAFATHAVSTAGIWIASNFISALTTLTTFTTCHLLPALTSFFFQIGSAILSLAGIDAAAHATAAIITGVTGTIAPIIGAAGVGAASAILIYRSLKNKNGSAECFGNDYESLPVLPPSP
ncbi:MAG: hypothetical protein KBD64_00530 [Gammaproteobacteria bacterium]|nr:hypothetical protein [Gammaproteobacteria bacterium]